MVGASFDQMLKDVTELYLLRDILGSRNDDDRYTYLAQDVLCNPFTYEPFQQQFTLKQHEQLEILYTSVAGELISAITEDNYTLRKALHLKSYVTSLTDMFPALYEEFWYSEPMIKMAEVIETEDPESIIDSYETLMTIRHNYKMFPNHTWWAFAFDVVTIRSKPLEEAKQQELEARRQFNGLLRF